MNLQFVNKFVKSTLALPLCPCQKDSMEAIHQDIHNPEINHKRLQNLIKSSPPDLKIISEDGKVIHSHKLLFGLINSNLAKLLLEEDFIGEHVTIFLPASFDTLIKVIEEGGQLNEVFSKAIATAEDDHNQYLNLKLNNSISMSEVEKEEPIYDDWHDPCHTTHEDKPVTIKIQKKSTFGHDEKGEKCFKCEREVSNLEVHKIACDQVSSWSGKTKVICPLCNRKVSFEYFVSFHYYKCSGWTIPGSDISRATYEEKQRVKRENRLLEPPVECPTCGKEVANYYNLAKHQETCDGVRRDHKCPYCKRKMQDNFETHVIACQQLAGGTNTPKSKVECPLCGKKVQKKCFVELHYYKCSNWTVPGCEEKRRNYESSEEKRKGSGPTTCEECGKNFQNSQSLKIHTRNVHNPDNIFHHCDKCEYKTSLKSLLKLHIYHRHSAPEYVTCHLCGDKFKSKPHLKQHISHKHEIQEIVKCEICGKDIKKHNYKGHLSRAHGEKKHGCELCTYRTTTKFNLKLHVSKSHMGLKEIPKSKCQYCDIETTNLPHHMGIHHPDKV